MKGDPRTGGQLLSFRKHGHHSRTTTSTQKLVIFFFCLLVFKRLTSATLEVAAIVVGAAPWHGLEPCVSGDVTQKSQHHQQRKGLKQSPVVVDKSQRSPRTEADCHTHDTLAWPSPSSSHRAYTPAQPLLLLQTLLSPKQVLRFRSRSDPLLPYPPFALLTLSLGPPRLLPTITHHIPRPLLAGSRSIKSASVMSGSTLSPAMRFHLRTSL